MRPEKLARELGVSGKHLRTWLRKTFPRKPEEKHQHWILTPAQEAAARKHFENRPRRVDSRAGMRPIVLYLPKALLKRLTAIAERHRLTLAALLRSVLSAFEEGHRDGGAR